VAKQFFGQEIENSLASPFSRYKSISEHGIAISKFGLRCSTAKAG
jgi:hypothetical protein